MLHDQERAPRARRRDANLARILDVAAEMVAEGGLESLSMNRLAAAVDYTPGALYRYFDSKDALLSKLVLRILTDVRATLDRAVALLPDRASPLAKTLALAAGYRAFARLEPHRFALLAMTLAQPRVLLEAPKDVEPVARMMMAALQPLASSLDEAAAQGLLSKGDAIERTLSVFALLEGALLLRKQARRAPGLVDVDRLAVHGTKSLLVGWGAKARSVELAAARVDALGDLTKRLGGAS